MSVPDKIINKKLYLEVKKEIYEAVPKHSAYRSGMLMKTYKKRGGKVKNTEEKNLSRWFEEKWVNLTPYAEGLTSSKTDFECGKKHVKQKGKSVCRPSVKVDKSTPMLAQKFTKSQIRAAIKIKNKGGTVIWSKL